jgi:hypothetical protein
LLLRVVRSGKARIWPAASGWALHGVASAGTRSRRCRICENEVVLREWLWRGRRLGGRLRIGVTSGLFFAICMGVVYLVMGPPRAAVGAAIGALVGGAGFGTVMAVYAGRSLRELSGLPPSDRVAVIRAVRRGEQVSDPRLAPSVLACAKSVMASRRRLQSPRWRWLFFAVAALYLVMALVKTTAGSASQAVWIWVGTVMFFAAGWAWPRELGRVREKAEAAADYAADQIGRPPAD